MSLGVGTPHTGTAGGQELPREGGAGRRDGCGEGPWGSPGKHQDLGFGRKEPELPGGKRGGGDMERVVHL